MLGREAKRGLRGIEGDESRKVEEREEERREGGDIIHQLASSSSSSLVSSLEGGTASLQRRAQSLLIRLSLTQIHPFLYPQRKSGGKRKAEEGFDNSSRTTFAPPPPPFHLASSFHLFSPPFLQTFRPERKCYSQPYILSRL